jgi:hypothetical protein
VTEPITREEAARRLFSGEWDELTVREVREQFPLIEATDLNSEKPCSFSSRCRHGSWDDHVAAVKGRPADETYTVIHSLYEHDCPMRCDSPYAVNCNCQGKCHLHKRPDPDSVAFSHTCTRAWCEECSAGRTTAND